jgi:predicted glycosyltransferase
MRVVYVGEIMRNRASQPRVLMFAHDGRGLGHLRRLSRIAEAMKDDFSVLMVTGHRSASWLVPEECEFIHIPSLDNLDPKRSHHWNRLPFWNEGQTKGRDLREGIIRAAIQFFQPNAIVLDYLPMGKDEEMYQFIKENTSGRSYFLLRGVLDSGPLVKQMLFNKKCSYLLEHCYDRIVVTCDAKIVDVATEYEFTPSLIAKTSYVGYVAGPIGQEQKAQARLERGISQSEKWVVCSGGGGQYAEELLLTCFDLACEMRGVFFDLVVGPRSRLDGLRSPDSKRVRVVKEDRSLPILHSACDVVVCPGGYNSLMEAIAGDASIIVAPLRGDWEQRTHATRLSQFYPISVLEDPSELAAQLARSVSTVQMRKPGDSALKMNGAESFNEMLVRDLKGSDTQQSRVANQILYVNAQ